MDHVPSFHRILCEHCLSSFGVILLTNKQSENDLLGVGRSTNRRSSRNEPLIVARIVSNKLSNAAFFTVTSAIRRISVSALIDLFLTLVFNLSTSKWGHGLPVCHGLPFCQFSACYVSTYMYGTDRQTMAINA